MTLTEGQKQAISAAKARAGEAAVRLNEVFHQLNLTEVNLTPDQEALLANQLVEWDNVVGQFLDAINRLMADIFDEKPEEAVEEKVEEKPEES